MFQRYNAQKTFENGQSLLDSGKYDEAIKAFTKVLENEIKSISDISPTIYSQVNRGLAYVCKFHSLVENDDFDSSDEGSKEVARNILRLAITDLDQSVTLLKPAAGKDQHVKETLVRVFTTRAQANYNLENTEETISDLSSAIKYDEGSNLDLYNKRGLLYLEDLEDPDLAIEDFLKASRIRSNFESFIYMAWAHIDSGNIDEAVKDYKKAKNLNSKAKEIERRTSIMKMHEWEQFKKEADNLLF